MYAELEARIAQLERRLASMIQPGRVTHVDLARKRIRLDLGDEDEPMLSPWVRYAQVAGALKMHTPPSLGQQMTLFSASGDLEQGLATPLGWSNDNVSPGDGAEPVMTFGDVRVTVEEGAVEVAISGAVIRFAAADGLSVTVGASSFNVTADQIRAASTEVRTSGKTVLNDGTREVVFKGSLDSHGDTNNQGAGSGVLV
ncbi:phage baseplate assembly protein V [Caulobacter sp. RL271]|uniref:Phage baseplate assembly protein V n=1 Tax=Caulobacter segnis TaxID=88688 RepID=A0ABY4ZWY3_9CAUL|nr:phage baseplate assembly protein V [Caulobacter segnis]USQ97245.1 phage baseplate assembly protein V [Caulobacter segnis]